MMAIIQIKHKLTNITKQEIYKTQIMKMNIKKTSRNKNLNFIQQIISIGQNLII
jgi:hypothetical protein